MKLKEIISEANMYSVDTTDPSGLGVPRSVDPDRVKKMLKSAGKSYSDVNDKHEADRSKRLKRKLQLAKGMRASPKMSGKVVSDNTDMTQSGANSAVNGNYNY